MVKASKMNEQQLKEFFSPDDLAYILDEKSRSPDQRSGRGGAENPSADAVVEAEDGEAQEGKVPELKREGEQS